MYHFINKKPKKSWIDKIISSRLKSELKSSTRIYTRYPGGKYKELHHIGIPKTVHTYHDGKRCKIYFEKYSESVVWLNYIKLKYDF